MQLLTTLEKLKTSGRFCCRASRPAILPGLEVSTVGKISFPIPPAQARAMIACAAQAPYGRGEETIVDTDVRRVWQLEPAWFTLKSQAWDGLVSELVESVKRDLTISGPVRPQLYKLLIYESGSFFAPHRDTEKEDGMFGTMVVCLPSQHEGGRLIVRHDGHSETFDFGPGSETEIQAAAFYADCLHEIEAVRSGYRVCLVYNLVRPKGRALRAPRQTRFVAAAREALRELFQERTRLRVAIPLNHQYSRAGLAENLLKGQDQAWWALLSDAARAEGYRIELAQMRFFQSGLGEEIGWNRYQLEEVYEESLTLECPGLGRLRLDREEILSRRAFEKLPFKEDVQVTGNEGVTIERRYRQAMILIWPPDRHLAMVAREGQTVALPALRDLIQSSDPSSLEFARAVLDGWQLDRGGRSQSARMLWCLRRLGDRGLARRFVSEILPRDFDGREGPALRGLAPVVGWGWLGGSLADLVAAQDGSSTRVLATLALLRSLCCAVGERRRPACLAMAGALEPLLRSWKWASSREGVLESLFDSLTAIDAHGLLDDLLTFILSEPKGYDLHGTLIPAVRSLRGPHSSTPGFRRLLGHCLRELERRTESPVIIPEHWSLTVEIHCRFRDCKSLEAFLRDPVERVFRYRAREEDRRHLSRHLDGADVELRTEKQGSPYTLVVTKNRASYLGRQKQLEKDTALLEELRMAELTQATR